MAPTLFTLCNTLPPEGAELAWGGPARRSLAPTLFTSSLRHAAPCMVHGAELAGGGPARRSLALSDKPVGLFISFEGIDGAGKSTPIAALAQAFTAQGRGVTCTREPGGTPLAEQLRALVLNQTMDALTETLLVFAARRDHVLQVIAPALQRGEVVLCDRFTDASFAYQGGGRGLDTGILSTLAQWVQSLDSPLPAATGVMEPHLTLWFDLPPAQAAARLAGARLPDKFEAEPLDFFTRVAQAYAQRQRQHPARMVRIDASLSPEAVAQALHQVLQAKGYLQPAAPAEGGAHG